MKTHNANKIKRECIPKLWKDLEDDLQESILDYAHERGIMAATKEYDLAESTLRKLCTVSYNSLV